MRRRPVLIPMILLGGFAFAVLLGLAVIGIPFGATHILTIHSDHSQLLADGLTRTKLLLRAADGQKVSPSDLSISITEGMRRARIESILAKDKTVEVTLRIGILPGAIVVTARGKHFSGARITLNTILDPADRGRDGMPDFLLLDDAADRQAFQRWFTFLAEAQAFRSKEDLPREISDSAGLLRFAYREALCQHDAAWATDSHLSSVPQIPSIQKYEYPYTPLGTDLYRVKPGVFSTEDLKNGSFSQFADAETLRRWNTHFVTRDIGRAQPGDMLFFRELEQDHPVLAMIFLGRSQMEAGDQFFVIFQTGPTANDAGGIRRMRLEELLQNPLPSWRPEPGNANFLGVYRWNILK